MLRHRFYYLFKPYLPWEVRMTLRRALARRQRQGARDVWPIDPSAGKTPVNWPGWPDGKRFSFVITHDVESQEGLAKCRQLMEVDREMGFKSVFNFIPEGPYRISKRVREDLEHNARSWHPRPQARRKAVRIQIGLCLEGQKNQRVFPRMGNVRFSIGIHASKPGLDPCPRHRLRLVDV